MITYKQFFIESFKKPNDKRNWLSDNEYYVDMPFAGNKTKRYYYKVLAKNIGPNGSPLSVYHREDGPAIEDFSGPKDADEYWIDGEELSKEEFLNWRAKKDAKEKSQKENPDDAHLYDL